MYQNPVFPYDFPDPFVLKYLGEYWAYCTGIRSDGRAFGILRSKDLITWEPIGSALDLLPGENPCYWAPEVTYLFGTFYLYYSVGNEKNMRIRVATSSSPAGPFTDSGRQLTHEEFAIDPHLFIDADGSLTLFYATDFLEHSHIGTGTACMKLQDPFTPASEPQPVTRAMYEWQVYDPARKEKGNVKWHTVEGPFVLKHKNKYFEMFSGGNWQNISYGVSYAISNELFPGKEWKQVSDGEQVLPIMRTVPNEIIGPGHNSVVRGTDNRQLYCIYHRWAEDGSGRVLAIDRMDWDGDTIIILGPTNTLQPSPLLAEQITGRTIEPRHSAFLLELSLRHEAPCIIQFDTTTGVYEITLDSAHHTLSVNLRADQDSRHIAQLSLPKEFQSNLFYLLRLDLNAGVACLAIEHTSIHWWENIGQVRSISIDDHTEIGCAEITYGWEDLFMQDGDPTESGWHCRDRSMDWYIENRELSYGNPEGESSLLSKGPFLEEYEFVVNARFAAEAANDGSYGFCPALSNDGKGPIFRIRSVGEGWSLLYDGPSGTTYYPLPAAFDSAVHQQFRFRKEHGELTVQWRDEPLGSIVITKEPTQIGLYAHRAFASFDLVRVTKL